jgi:hypothetical protein
VGVDPEDLSVFRIRDEGSPVGEFVTDMFGKPVGQPV